MYLYFEKYEGKRSSPHFGVGEGKAKKGIAKGVVMKGEVRKAESIPLKAWIGVEGAATQNGDYDHT